jgi:hypothetical protein
MAKWKCTKGPVSIPAYLLYNGQYQCIFINQMTPERQWYPDVVLSTEVKSTAELLTREVKSTDQLLTREVKSTTLYFPSLQFSSILFFPSQ